METYRTLEKELAVPDEFRPVLRRLISLEESQVLVLITKEFHTLSTIVNRLGKTNSEEICSLLEALYQKGIVSKKKIDGKEAYRCRRFYNIISQYLQEHRYEELGIENLHALRQFYSFTRIEKTEKDIKTGRISSSSKVIPIEKAFDARQYILPTEQALHFLKEANTVALTDCGCRMTFENCKNPVDTCLLFDEEAKYLISRGYARQITLDEARKVLKIANQAGLVHLTLYLPDQKVYAVCSCCPCCCHDLQPLLEYGKTSFVAKSDYIATVDTELCDGCGICIERCVFSARKLQNGKSTLIAEKCYGCGLCVTTCPTDATKLVSEKHKTT
ncbi:MAG: ATP-binding protein [Promethearchaeota archaeon]